MGLHSLRILAQAGFSGVFLAAKILRGELPRYRLPLPEFAANVIPCSAPPHTKISESWEVVEISIDAISTPIVQQHTCMQISQP